MSATRTRMSVHTLAGQLPLQTTTPATPIPSDHPYAGLGEAVGTFVLIFGIVYATVVILIAAPIGVYLISRREPNVWISSVLVPPAVGSLVHLVLLLSVEFDPFVTRTFTLYFFLPAALLLSAVGYLGHRSFG